MTNDYRMEVDNIKQACSDIEWEADRITDILDGRDFVEIPVGYYTKLRGIEDQLNDLRTEIE